MTHRITNNSLGPRGIWSNRRLVWIEPGASKIIVPDNVAAVRRLADVEIQDLGHVPPVPKGLAASFDHDGDGKAGGSKKQTGDDLPALRAAYKAATGKNAFNGWDAGTLKDKIAAAAK